MKFQFYQDDKGEWRWRLVARNGKIIADSAEGYVNKAAMIRIVKRIKEGFANVRLPEEA